MPLPTQYFEDVVSEVVHEIGFDDYIMKVEDGTARGQNFLGAIYRVKIEGECDGSYKKSNLIVKLLPESEKQRQQMQMENFSDREAFVYREVIPWFDRLQDKFNVKDKLNHVKMHRVLSEKYKEMLVMNDLSAEGYRSSKDGRNLDLEHSTIIMQELGKLHALSLAMKHYKPEECKKLRKLDEVLLTDKNVFMKKIIEDHVRHGFESVCDPSVIKVLRGLHEGSYEKAMELLKYESTEQHGVLCHGDLWASNVLFKYEHGAPQKALFLDWQLSRLCSPASDIYLFLFTSTDVEMRAANFQNLLSAYYSSLSAFLRELRCNPEEIFSEQDFRYQMKKFALLGLVINLVQLPVFTARHEDVHLEDLDFSRTDQKALFGPQTPSLDYIERVTSMVRDMLNNDLL